MSDPSPRMAHRPSIRARSSAAIPGRGYGFQPEPEHGGPGNWKPSILKRLSPEIVVEIAEHMEHVTADCETKRFNLAVDRWREELLNSIEDDNNSWAEDESVKRSA